MRFLHLILSNLKRRKLRTALTLLSIVVAFILYGYLAAIARAMDQGVSLAGADRLIVRHRVSITQPLPENYQRRILSIPGVQAAAHASWFGGIYQDPRNFFAQMAIIPEEYLDLYPEFLLPEDQRLAFIRTRTGAIAGRRLAQKYGWKIGDRIPLQATVWVRKNGETNWDFELVGIYDGAEEGTDTTNFYFHYDYLDEARAFGEGLVGWYMVRVQDPDRAATVGPFDRRRIRQFAPGNQDGNRRRLSPRLGAANRRYHDHHERHPECRLLHHPPRHRQHHGPIGP